MEEHGSISISPASSDEQGSPDGQPMNGHSPFYREIEEHDDPAGMLPGTEDYGGPMNFQLFLNTEDKTKRSWLYSQELRKLYVDINKVVCVQFKMKRPDERINSSREMYLVRALPVYASPEYLREPVSRCPVHVMSDKNAGHENSPWLYHVLKAEHHEAEYQSHEKSKRHSVVVPLHTPSLGSEFVTIMYKFTCKTSCAFGLNRRPVHVLFTLENAQGRIIGRRKLLVKVCSCPKRDLQRDEAVSKTEAEPVSRKRRGKEMDNSMFQSVEIFSPPTKEIKIERLEAEEESVSGGIRKAFYIPQVDVPKKKWYLSTLKAMHSHLIGIAVRNDALIELHPAISVITEAMKRARGDHDDESPAEDSPPEDSPPEDSPVVSPPQAVQDTSNAEILFTYQVADTCSGNPVTPEVVTTEIQYME